MTDDELKGLFEALRQDNIALREDSAAIRNDNIALRHENAASHAETRRLFGEAADRIATENRQFFGTEAEGLRHEIRLVAEGVTGTREMLTRETAGIREEVRRTAGETQAMITH